MANPKSVRPLGDSLLITMTDGAKFTAYPSGGHLWFVRTQTTTTPPPATAGLTDWFTSVFGMNNGWEGHASYSRGGSDWAMPVGTEIKAVADGNIVNYPNIDGAGLKTMLVFDASFTRKVAASTTLMNGVYTENPTAPAVAFMMQHLSSQVVERHVVSGEVVAISGNTGETTGPHLHAQLLATPEVAGDRLDFMKFV